MGFKSEKVILSKNDMFGGKDYSIIGMFKLNTENEIIYAYIAESFELMAPKIRSHEYQIH